MAVLVIEVPDRKAPGFPKRLKKVTTLLAALKNLDADNFSPEVVDALIEGLLPYVAEPKDPEAAREALWDASQEQFEEALQALAAMAPLSVTPSKRSSRTGTRAPSA